MLQKFSNRILQNNLLTAISPEQLPLVQVLLITLSFRSYNNEFPNAMAKIMLLPESLFYSTDCSGFSGESCGPYLWWRQT